MFIFDSISVLSDDDWVIFQDFEDGEILEKEMSRYSLLISSLWDWSEKETWRSIGIMEKL